MLTGWNGHKVSCVISRDKITQNRDGYCAIVTLSEGSGSAYYDHTALFDYIGVDDCAHKFAFEQGDSGNELYAERVAYDPTNKRIIFNVFLFDLVNDEDYVLNIYCDKTHADNNVRLPADIQGGFSGSSIDKRLWCWKSVNYWADSTLSTTLQPDVRDGRLICANDADMNTAQVHICTTASHFASEGAFVLEIDYDTSSADSSTSLHSYFWGSIDYRAYFEIDVVDSELSARVNNDTVWGTKQTIAKTSDTFTLRVERTAVNNFIMSVDQGGGFVQLLSEAITSQPLRIIHRYKKEPLIQNNANEITVSDVTYTSADGITGFVAGHGSTSGQVTVHPDCVARYNFSNENTGDQLIDSGFNQLHGNPTSMSTTVLTNENHGGSWKLDGSNDYIQINSVMPFISGVANIWSYCASLKRQAEVVGSDVLLSCHGSSGNTNAFLAWQYNGSALLGGSYYNSSYSGVGSGNPGTITNNGTFHVVGSSSEGIEGGYFRGYKNGSLNHQSVITSNLPSLDADGRMTIGAEYDSSSVGDFLDGWVSHFSIWSVTLDLNFYELENHSVQDTLFEYGIVRDTSDIGMSPIRTLSLVSSKDLVNTTQTNFPLKIRLASDAGDSNFDNTEIFDDLTPEVPAILNCTNQYNSQPDRRYWSIQTAELAAGAHECTGGAIRIECTSNNIDNTSHYARIQSRFKLKGDFTLEVSIKDYSYSGVALYAMIYIGSYLMGFRDSNLFVGNIGAGEQSSSSRSEIYGKLKAERSGSTWTISYKNGDAASWTQLTTASGTTDDVYIAPTAYCWNNDDFVVASFYDFVITADAIVWPAPDSLVVHDRANGVRLKTEVAYWDGQNKTAELWTKSLSFKNDSDTILGISWDHMTSNTDDTGGIGSTPAQSVWDANFKAVYHLSQDPTTGGACILDSTSNVANATPNGSISDILISDTKNLLTPFDGADDNITIPQLYSTVPDELTTEVIFKKDVLTVAEQRVMAYNEDGLFVFTGVGDDASSTVVRSYMREAADTDIWANGSTSHDSTVLTYVAEVAEVDRFKTLIDGTTTEGWASYVGKNDITGSEGRYIGSGRQPGYFFDGSIGEVRFSDVVRSDEWLRLTKEALIDNLFTFSFTSPIVIEDILYKDFIQVYDMVDKFVIDLVQKYGMSAASLVRDFVQVYGMEMVVDFIQKYGASDTLWFDFMQYYGQSQKLLKDFLQRYSKCTALTKDFTQPYEERGLLLKDFLQKYVESQGVHKVDFRQVYSLKNTTGHVVDFVQPYSVIRESNVQSINEEVKVNGIKVDVAGISSLQFSIDFYCGSCTLPIIDRNVFDSINLLDPVDITINNQVFNLVVSGKEDYDSHKAESYNITARSIGIILDYPYVDEIEDDSLVNGKASQIVASIAAIKGLGIQWQLECDPILTSNNVQISGSSPLQAIRNIVNELGGKLNSLYDGSLVVRSRYIVDSDKLDSTTPSRTFNIRKEFKSIKTVIDKRECYNRFSISEDSSASGYELKSEEITSSKYKIKAFKSPWSDRAVFLTTSELTNVTIQSLGMIIEVIDEEDIEIKNGEGTLSNNYYGTKSFNYGTRTNLGPVSITEDGIVTTETAEDTFINISYYTKYWAWEVSGSDEEAVQLSLRYI